MKYRILIVEDDPAIAGAVKRQIEAWGCEARTAENFADVTADFRSFAPHLVLMDIGLPLYDGYHWCAEIRKISRVPVIFLSSASDNMNILMALNMGGDDFIAKPFDLNVLTAKVQALLRRTYDFAVQSEVLECGGAVLHPDEADAGRGRAEDRPDQERTAHSPSADGEPRPLRAPGGHHEPPVGDGLLCGRQHADGEHDPAAP